MQLSKLNVCCVQIANEENDIFLKREKNVNSLFFPRVFSALLNDFNSSWSQELLIIFKQIFLTCYFPLKG